MLITSVPEPGRSLPAWLPDRSFHPLISTVLRALAPVLMTVEMSHILYEYERSRGSEWALGGCGVSLWVQRVPRECVLNEW